jgi:hypothetical protein
LDINSDFDEMWPSLRERVDALGNLHRLFWLSLEMSFPCSLDECE